jgi:hypothetical protein
MSSFVHEIAPHDKLCVVIHRHDGFVMIEGFINQLSFWLVKTQDLVLELYWFSNNLSTILGEVYETLNHDNFIMTKCLVSVPSCLICHD